MERQLKAHDPNTTRVYPLSRLHAEFEDGTSELIVSTPEQVAVAIAKCSRSETPFDQNLIDVSLEKAAKFHDKWVVGYGHGSVAEHAVASVAFENISQIVIKILEDSRLASYTEKSSRYIVFSRERVVLPSLLTSGAFAPIVTDFLDRLYGLYDTIQELVRPLMYEKFPKPEEMTEGAYAAVTKARVCDVARYCLPAAAAGSLGMTANARNWGGVISKLASSPYEEARKLADELLSHLRARAEETPDEALTNRVFPTLLKYAGYNTYQATLPGRMQSVARQLLTKINDTAQPQATRERPVVVVHDEAHAEALIAAALIAKASREPMSVVLKHIRSSPEMIERIINEATADRGEHDQLPREFEHAVFQHEIVMDYGAWRDVQRHRMCTQLNQSLGIDLGFVIPEEVKEVQLEEAYCRLMEEAASLHRQLTDTGHAEIAEYLVPMAYRRRLIMTWNLRELDHFITLRSGKKGHPSYRRIAQETWRSLEATHPLLASLIHVDLDGNEAGLSTLGAKPKGF
jgi:thymidylate synthase ThyX